MQFMDVMAPLAALHIIRHPKAVQRLLSPSIKPLLNLPTPRGWKDECIQPKEAVASDGCSDVRGLEWISSIE